MSRPEIQAAAFVILAALREENDRGFYGAKYRTAHEVAQRADRSVSTATKWLSYLADKHLVDSTARSGRRGGWRINDEGRTLLNELDRGRS